MVAEERKRRQWVASLRRFRHNLGIRWSEGFGDGEVGEESRCITHKSYLFRILVHRIRG